MNKARIVVMVGHELKFLEDFCTRVIWMQKGQILAMGPATEIIAAYKADAAKPKQETTAAARAA